MEWFIVAIVAFLFLGTSLVCLVALLARQRVQRHHRVDPSIPTDAPLTALVDPRTPARLHRRLARVGTLTSAVIDDHTPRSRRRRQAKPSTLASLAEELRAQAVMLDQQVSRLAYLVPAARGSSLLQVQHNVSEIEAASARLVALSTQARAPRGLDTDDSSVSEISQRLDRLAEAHQQLLDLDGANRLAETPLPAPPLTSPGNGSSSPSAPPRPRSGPR